MFPNVQSQWVSKLLVEQGKLSSWLGLRVKQILLKRVFRESKRIKYPQLSFIITQMQLFIWIKELDNNFPDSKSLGLLKVTNKTRLYHDQNIGYQEWFIGFLCN